MKIKKITYLLSVIFLLGSFISSSFYLFAPKNQSVKIEKKEKSSEKENPNFKSFDFHYSTLNYDYKILNWDYVNTFFSFEFLTSNPSWGKYSEKGFSQYFYKVLLKYSISPQAP